MKKLFILPVLLISISAMAQTKPVQPVKPPTDTIYHLNPVDVFNRAYIMQRATLLLVRPDDISANEKKFITKSLDSLSNVDGTWFNKVKKP